VGYHDFVVRKVRSAPPHDYDHISRVHAEASSSFSHYT
jgi:hypothetical protein